MNDYVIRDFGDEYVISRNGEDLFTCWSPEDAERIASMLFQLDEIKEALRCIADGTPEKYHVELSTFTPYEKGSDLALYALSVADEPGGGMFTWEIPCPDCDGQGCKKCDNTGGVKVLNRRVLPPE